MYTEDFILRQINLAAAILRAVLGLKEAGQLPQAQQAIDEALEQLLGLRANLLNQLDDRSLLEMLSAQNERDTGRLALLAELFKEQGEILAMQGHTADSQIAYQRALRFYLEAALDDLSLVGKIWIGRIGSVSHALGDTPLPLETQMAYLDYLEWLRSRPDTELAASGMSRAQLEAQIESLQDFLNQF